MTKEINSDLQKEHYNNIHDIYVDHYYDHHSSIYREKYIYSRMFDGIDLNNKKVAEIACGSGDNSLYVINRFPDVEIEGYDISEKACADYIKKTGSKCSVLDLTKVSDSYNEQFDAVFVVGGIHHCVVDLESTFKNIEKMLKPGGIFIMNEPNSEYILEGMRKFWYKKDDYFEDQTEEALANSKLLKTYGKKFKSQDCTYYGGPAYFLIYNSMMFRMNKRVKSIISPPLMLLETLYNLLPSKYLFACFVSRWEKL